MPREANEERKHNYEETIDYDSHYDEHRDGELQRHPHDHNPKRGMAERRHFRRHPNQNGRDLRCEQEVALQTP